MALTLATFNVKDLFDASDDASRAGLEAKLDTLGAILAEADADVVALQEVGSEAVVRALGLRAAAAAATARGARDRGPFRPYTEAVIGAADARGIRCALLSRLPVVESEARTAPHLDFPGFVVGDPPPFGTRIPLRRAVVRARVDAGALGKVDVIVVHFKSNRPMALQDEAGTPLPPTTSRAHAEGHLRSLICRTAEALFVRGMVDDLVLDDPARHVVVAGDLNDHAASQVVRTVSGGGPMALVRCADTVPQSSRFSILRYGAPQQIDHVLASPGLSQHLQSARFLNDGLRDHSTFTRDGSTEEPPSADSDHAALVVSFA
jgi:endonuclease/exonuclease/phosphatase family metal-dependent hydrolase